MIVPSSIEITSQIADTSSLQISSTFDQVSKTGISDGLVIFSLFSD